MRRAYANRTFVVVDAQQAVVGYYALAAGAVSHQVATAAVRRIMQVSGRCWCTPCMTGPNSFMNTTVFRLCRSTH